MQIHRPLLVCLCILSLAACGKSDDKKGKAKPKGTAKAKPTKPTKNTEATTAAKAAPWTAADLKRLVATKVDGYDTVKGEVVLPAKDMTGPPVADVEFHQKREGKPTLEVHVSAHACGGLPMCKATLASMKKENDDMLDKAFASEEHKNNPKKIWDVSEVTIAGKPRLSMHYSSYLKENEFDRGLKIWMTDGVNLIHLQVAEDNLKQLKYASAAALDASLPKAKMLEHATAVLTVLNGFFSKK